MADVDAVLAGLAAGRRRGAVVKQRPLEGVRVLDLTMMWAGPYATKMLGEMGADVIKIESPRAWDNIRTLMPRADVVEDPWNSAFYFAEYNHEKRSVTLDLAQPAGKEAFLRLVANSDVVIENYRADVMDNLGLTADVLAGRQARPRAREHGRVRQERRRQATTSATARSSR